MAIKTIFFDLGGVLIDFSHQKMCKNISKLTGLDPKTVHAHLFQKEIAKSYERGEIDTSDLHRYFSSLCEKEIEFQELLKAITRIFSPKRDMPPLLEELRRQNISLYLLSNTCEAHFLYLQKHFDFLKFFDGFTLSYEIKARKPEKAIFLAALKLGRTKACECFYTDDVAEYIDVASQHGLDGHTFKNKNGLIEALSKRGLFLE